MLSSAVNRARAARKNDKGFTLIELLIVIVILGILAAIVVFSVQGITDRGTKSACKANIKSAQVASEAYYAQVGAYPSAIIQLTQQDPLDTIAPAGIELKLLQEAPPAGIVSFNAGAEPTYKALGTC